jgi:competence protein ComEC
MRLILLLVFILSSLLAPAAAAGAGEEMSLYVLNVGKADSMILRSGENIYLIDTGRGSTMDVTESALKEEGITHLDAVIITHMDSDHVGGLKKLLKSDVTLDHIYVPAYFLQEEKDKENPAIKAAEKQGRETEILEAGQTLPLGEGKITVLGPISPATDKEDNNSLVLLAEAAGGSILLGGDMEFPEEASLLRAGVIPRADVLKVGNHGDDDATSPALLSAVQPKAAVISTSTEEKASTPAKRVLKALEAWNTQVYQTQEAEWGIRATVRDGEITAERLDRLP